MHEYEVKRGMSKDLPIRIATGFTDIFETEPIVAAGHYSISYGSLSHLEVWAGEKNKTVIVDTETNTEVLSMPSPEADAIILDTNKRFRQYLYLITGFTTKERIKRTKKAVEKEK
ncbi:MAG TPA: DUF5611 family protein [Methanocorpusculum sp.]|nr:DUF5611 family protein [Methanocorpusculum sp.]HJJ90897.1 DUF5611 family protein [Methanocorpusculum sp.]